MKKKFYFNFEINVNVGEETESYKNIYISSNTQNPVSDDIIEAIDNVYDSSLGHCKVYGITPLKNKPRRIDIKLSA